MKITFGLKFNFAIILRNLFCSWKKANSVLDVQYRKRVVKKGDKLGIITTLRLVPAYFTLSPYTTQCLICMHLYEEIYGQLTLNKYRENSAEYKFGLATIGQTYGTAVVGAYGLVLHAIVMAPHPCCGGNGFVLMNSHHGMHRMS